MGAFVEVQTSSKPCAWEHAPYSAAALMLMDSPPRANREWIARSRSCELIWNAPCDCLVVPQSMNWIVPTSTCRRAGCKLILEVEIYRNFVACQEVINAVDPDLRSTRPLVAFHAGCGFAYLCSVRPARRS